jgi:hypothetical protein
MGPIINIPYVSPQITVLVDVDCTVILDPELENWLDQHKIPYEFRWVWHQGDQIGPGHGELAFENHSDHIAFLLVWP